MSAMNSNGLWNDKEMVLAAMKQNGVALKHAAESLRADRNFVLEAVKQNGAAPACSRGAPR